MSYLSNNVIKSKILNVLLEPFIYSRDIPYEGVDPDIKYMKGHCEFGSYWSTLTDDSTEVEIYIPVKGGRVWKFKTFKWGDDRDIDKIPISDVEYCRELEYRIDTINKWAASWKATYSNPNLKIGQRGCVR